MRLKLLFLICVFVSMMPCVHAFNIDSVKMQSSQLKDTFLSDHYYQIAKYYYVAERNPDSLVKYALLALGAAERAGSISRIITTKRIVGIGYTELMKKELALKYYEEALVLAKRTNNLMELVKLNNNLGAFYGKFNDFGKSTYYLIEATKGFEKLGDYDGVVNCYKNINVIFFSQKQYKKLMFYQRKTLALIPKFKGKESENIVADIYEDAANFYLAVGNELNDTALIDTAVIFANEAIRISKENDFPMPLANAYYVLSHNASIRKDNVSALKYAKMAMQYKRFLSEDEVIKLTFAYVDANINQQDYKTAKLYLDTCAMYPKSRTLQSRFFVSQRRYVIEKHLGHPGEALKALEDLMEVTDTIRQSEVNASINELETKYQSEIKDTRIKELNQQKRIDHLQIRSLIFTLLAIAALLIVILLFYRQTVLKNQQKRIEAELRLNRARMDPHFFFNALSSIQTLSMGDHKAQTSLMLSKFSKIMRQALESTYNELITVEEELNFLTNYIELQKLRYPDKFDFEVETADDMEAYAILLPSMILQPFVENAIEHGFKNISYKGKITIALTAEGESLHILMTDNGNFFSSEIKHKEYPSRATQIVKDRLFLLEKQSRKKTSLDISQDENAKGYRVRITMPLMMK